MVPALTSVWLVPWPNSTPPAEPLITPDAVLSIEPEKLKLMPVPEVPVMLPELVSETNTSSMLPTPMVPTMVPPRQVCYCGVIACLDAVAPGLPIILPPLVMVSLPPFAWIPESNPPFLFTREAPARI